MSKNRKHRVTVSVPPEAEVRYAVLRSIMDQDVKILDDRAEDGKLRVTFRSSSGSRHGEHAQYMRVVSALLWLEEVEVNSLQFEKNV